MDHKHTNGLIEETSPYLLQHAHNPVNWYPWGKPALEKAKLENKVMLVSIGYSACHWCHVMERESFEDEATAALMNEYFVNIKIDREERPDIDQVYMDAVQAITGSGGWPLNVFLTPDGRPFYGGTYFPPTNAFTRPSWKEVLSGVAQAWTERRTEIEAQADNLTAHIGKSDRFTLPVNNAVKINFESELGFEKCDAMFAALMQSADKVWGGFGKAPKFPQTFSIQFLLQYYHYSDNPMALQQAVLSIDKMLEGGIYDHIAGGMARYSTDNEWLAPHFEKMLYDNALLIIIMCDAYQLTGLGRYKEAINKTIGFIKNELMHPGGAFYAALDADSEGEEGKFYKWQKAEIEKILGEDAPLFCDFFDVTEAGNWEGENILRILIPADDFVKARSLNRKEFFDTINKCLQKLQVERSRRTRPGLDDKIILSWNALMLKAIARAAIVLKDETLKVLALNNFEFLQKEFEVPGNPGQMKHTWKNGRAKHPAFLEDYACLVDACLQLYELTFDTSFIEKAKLYCKYVVEHFSDEEEVFFYFTHKNQDDIIVRKKEMYDGATASANAVMALNLFRLSVIFDDALWRVRSDNMLMAMSAAVVKYPTSFAVWGSILMQKIKGTTEIAVVGTDALRVAGEIAADCYIPGRVMMTGSLEDSNYPMLRGKNAGNPAFIYICKNYMCNAPITTLAEFLSTLKKQ